MQILAEQNLCSQEHIINILLEGGIKQQELPRNRKKEPAPEKKTAAVPETAKAKPDKATSVDAATAYINDLLAKRKALCVAVIDIDKQLKALAELCMSPAGLEELT